MVNPRDLSQKVEKDDEETEKSWNFHVVPEVMEESPNLK